MNKTSLAFAALILPISAQDASPWETWERYNNWSIGDVLFPNLHLHGVGGFSSGDQQDLSSGAHDPQRESFSAQAIEPGLSLRTKHIEGFSNYLFSQDGEGDWDGEWEEAFGKITTIPGGFELKGGQYLSRYGAMNDKHLHAWDFVDSETVLGRFLGDDGLLLRGGELSWILPLGMDPTFESVMSLGFGNAVEHSHSHGHDDEHSDEEEPGEHHEEHAEHEDHDHEDGNALHHGEEAALKDDVWTTRLMGRYRFDDFYSLTAGFSLAGGKNGFGRDTMVSGLDVEYQWRENGLEAGGRAFRWRNELLWRDVEAFSEHDDNDDGIVDETFLGTYQEWGFYSQAIYTWNARLDTGLRIGWVEGVDDFGQSETLRISPVVSCWLDDARRLGLRLQYNYDSISSRDDEHSLWLQLNISLGSDQEVR